MAANTAGKRYADPGLQADRRKRYALDTPEEIRAALSYVGMPKNRGKYSADDLTKVEASIHAAAKQAGIDAKPVSLATAARGFVARTST